jgi:lysophospholipase L1-like esterase
LIRESNRVASSLVCLIASSFWAATTPSLSDELAPSSVGIPRGGLVAAEGDSLTYGMDISNAGIQTQINGATQARSISPYPETLADQLRGCAHVANRGFPGDRSVDGLVRWQAAAPANFTILMYGSNDALNNGGAATGPITVETFKSVMELLAKRRLQTGGKVLLLSPPPIGNAHLEKLIDPYRAAVRDTARGLGIGFMDTGEMLKGVSPVWTKDQVHLSPSANIAIATSTSRLIDCR